MRSWAIVRKVTGVIATALLLAAVGPSALQVVRARAQGGPTTASSELEILQVRPDFYLIAGAGANVAVQTGADGTVIVDAGRVERGDDLVAAIRKLTSRPIRYIINTGADADHVGGNATVARAGRTIFNIGNNLGAAMTHNGAASILANEKVLFRMSAPTGQTSPFPAAAWPTETFETGRKYMYLNGEAIEVLHQPRAHADGDSFVMFRRSDVVVAGDILDTTAFPIIDMQKGGSIQGEIEALNRLVNLAVPSIPLVWQEGGTSVIPGHGRVSDQTDVVEYRDMATIVRDRVQALLNDGMTLAQVQAANPAQGYATRYGSTSPSATRIFIESVYASLSSLRAK